MAKLCLYLEEREWYDVVLKDLETMWKEDKQEDPSLDFKINLRKFLYSTFTSLVEEEGVDGIVVYIGNELVEIFDEEKFYEEVVRYLKGKHERNFRLIDYPFGEDKEEELF